MSRNTRRLLFLPAALFADSAVAQDMCGLALGAEPVRIVSDGDPLRVSLRSGEIVHARAISLARGMARLDSDVLGTLEVTCAMVVAASQKRNAAPAGNGAPGAMMAPLAAREAEAIRGRGPATQPPAQSPTQPPARTGNASPPVIRPDLEEALRRAELLRNPDNPQVGSGRVRLTSSFNYGLAGSVGNRSREVGVSQQVSYGWTDRLTTFASVSYGHVAQETLTLTGAGTPTLSNQVDSGISSYTAGASYRLNRPTAALPAFTVTGLAAVPARAPRTLDASRVGEGHRSATVRVEAGREYDSVSWTATVFATAFGSETISDREVQPGFQSGVDLFGALMLNDRYSVFSSVTFTDRQRTASAGLGVPGADRQQLSMEFGFISELTRGWYLSARIGSLLGSETGAANIGAAITLEF